MEEGRGDGGTALGFLYFSQGLARVVRMENGDEGNGSAGGAGGGGGVSVVRARMNEDEWGRAS